MQQWDYLSFRIAWDSRLEQPGDQTVQGWDVGDGKLREINEILIEHGAHGWELVSLFPDYARQNPTGVAGGPSFDVEAYRVTFKRPKQ
jgi:hypothetical protein